MLEQTRRRRRLIVFFDGELRSALFKSLSHPRTNVMYRCKFAMKYTGSSAGTRLSPNKMERGKGKTVLRGIFDHNIIEGGSTPTKTVL